MEFLRLEDDEEDVPTPTSFLNKKTTTTTTIKKKKQQQQQHSGGGGCISRDDRQDNQQQPPLLLSSSLNATLPTSSTSSSVRGSTTTTTTNNNNHRGVRGGGSSVSVNTTSSSPPKVPHNCRSTYTCQKHLSNAVQMDIRMNRKNWCEELCSIKSQTEFQFYKSTTTPTTTKLTNIDSITTKNKKNNISSNSTTATTASVTSYDELDDNNSRRSTRSRTTVLSHQQQQPSEQIAYAVEDSNWFCRVCCSVNRPFQMIVRDTETNHELFTVQRTLSCQPGPCKCCCYQKAYILTSTVGEDDNNDDPIMINPYESTTTTPMKMERGDGDSTTGSSVGTSSSRSSKRRSTNSKQQSKQQQSSSIIGSIEEIFYFCIPTFLVRDHLQRKMYTIHPPTCCFGLCMNCCTEGNPFQCTNSCCTVPFWIYGSKEYDHYYKNNNKCCCVPSKQPQPLQQPIGKIVKKMKSSMPTDWLAYIDNPTNTNSFEVLYPEYATVDQKAILSGSALFLNTVFFDSDDV